MVPVVSAVEGANGSECVLLLRARMAVAALAMRRRALWGFASQDASRYKPFAADAISSKRKRISPLPATSAPSLILFSLILSLLVRHGARCPVTLQPCPSRARMLSCLAAGLALVFVGRNKSTFFGRRTTFGLLTRH